MSLQIEMIYFECWVCGVPFGMSKQFERVRRADGAGFKCVRGCGLCFGIGEVNRLKAALEREISAKANAEARAAKAEKKAKRWKCTQCPKDYATQQALISHMRLTHESPLRLAKNAGPDALNTNVGAK